MKHIWSWVFNLCLLSVPIDLYSYAYLSEYLSADGQSLRPESSTEGSDLLKHPKWYSNISVVLCTGGNAISSIAPDAQDFDEWTDELTAAANAAADTWENAGSGTSLVFQNITKSEDCGPNLGQAYGGKQDSQNRLFFNNRFEDGTLIPDSVIAFTVLSLEADNGKLKIVDADIIFNVSAFDNAGETDFQGVLTHEFGHFIGIAHSLVTDDNNSDGLSTVATMYPAISGDGSGLSQLVRDDELAVQNLYPADNTGGSVEGYVYRADGSPQRGAHITAFAIDSAISLGASFSSMSKTRAGYDGSYSIQKLPLNTDFIVFVEPPHRPSSGLPNFLYNVINTPIYQALRNEEEGYRSFSVEAYPDVQIVDIRETRNILVAPGIEDAQIFRLHSGNRQIKDINFYLSQEFLPPNDAVNTSLEINPSSADDLVVNNSKPLQLWIEIPTDLKIFEDPTLQLTATVNGQTRNWTSTIPNFEWKTQSALITIELPSPPPQDGNYEIQFKLSDPKYGNFSTSRLAKIRSWTQSEAGVQLGSQNDANEANRSGGGCFIQTENSASFMPIVFLFFALLIVLRKNHRLLERRSCRAQRQSAKPEQPF